MDQRLQDNIDNQDIIEEVARLLFQEQDINKAMNLILPRTLNALCNNLNDENNSNNSNNDKEDSIQICNEWILEPKNFDFNIEKCKAIITK